MTTAISIYESEILSALYKVLDYATCNDMASDEVQSMILKIESKTQQPA